MCLKWGWKAFMCVYPYQLSQTLQGLWIQQHVPEVGLEELRYMMVLLLHMSEGAVGSVSLQVRKQRVLRGWVSWYKMCVWIEGPAAAHVWGGSGLSVFAGKKAACPSWLSQLVWNVCLNWRSCCCTCDGLNASTDRACIFATSVLHGGVL